MIPSSDIALNSINPSMETMDRCELLKLIKKWGKLIHFLSLLVGVQGML